MNRLRLAKIDEMRGSVALENPDAESAAKADDKFIDVEDDQSLSKNPVDVASDLFSGGGGFMMESDDEVWSVFTVTFSCQ